MLVCHLVVGKFLIFEVDGLGNRIADEKAAFC